MKTILTALTSLFLPLLVWATEIPREDWQIDRKEMTEPLSAGTSVHVTNPHGDIRVRSHNKPEVFILVNSQRHRDDPLKFEIDICENGQSLAILAVVEPHDDAVPEAFSERRIDMTVFLPRETNVRFETAQGFIESRGLAGDLKIVSEWGDIRAFHGGAAEIQTTYGDVNAVFFDTRWSKDSRIETLTGAIIAGIAKDPSLEVELETHGKVTTDYSIEIHYDEQTELKSGSSKLGDARRALSLVSNRGDISLLRSDIEQPEDQENTEK